MVSYTEAVRLTDVDARLLATLEAIVREGSFGAAADELGITPSAVSQQMTELERRLGRPVLHRRPLRPTPAGDILVDAALRARGALARAQALLDALDDGESGRVRVGAFTSATAGPVAVAVASFRAEFPGVKVELVQAEPPDCYDGLLRGDLDVSVTYLYPQSPQPVPSGIVVRQAAVDDFVAVLPRAHRLARRRSVDLQDLQHEDLIGTPLTRLPFPWPGERRPRTEEIGVVFEGEDYTTTLRLVSHGLGVALLPRLVAREPGPAVRVVPLRGRPWVRNVYVATVEGERESLAAAEMRAHLHSALAG